MIYLTISDLALSPPVTHLSTDWQVSDNVNFNTTIAQSLGDTANLTSIMFDVVLDSQIQYYARSRVRLSTGYTAWSNIDIFTPKNINDSNINMPLPSIISLPKISMPNNGIDVPIMNATITVAPIDTLGTAVHTSTSYVVEDINGVPVWTNMYNVTDRNTISIPMNVLNLNTAYRARVMIHTDSNDTSQLATFTFKTETPTQELVVNNLEAVSSRTNLQIDVIRIPGVTSFTAELYSYVNRTPKHLRSITGTGHLKNILTVPAADLNPRTPYMIRINTNNPNIWAYRFFTVI